MSVLKGETGVERSRMPWGSHFSTGQAVPESNVSGKD